MINLIMNTPHLIEKPILSVQVAEAIEELIDIKFQLWNLRLEPEHRKQHLIDRRREIVSLISNGLRQMKKK